MNVFEIFDKSGRKIRLTKKQWSHIRRDHPDVQEHEIESTLVEPLQVMSKGRNKFYYYAYFENRKFAAKYLRVIVKYLNGEGFVVTAYFVKHTS